MRAARAAKMRHLPTQTPRKNVSEAELWLLPLERRAHSLQGSLSDPRSFSHGLILFSSNPLLPVSTRWSGSMDPAKTTDLHLLSKARSSEPTNG